MNDKQLLMIILAFFAGYMFDKIMNKMCSSSLKNNRLIEGLNGNEFKDGIADLQNGNLAKWMDGNIWKVESGSSDEYNTNLTIPHLTPQTFRDLIDRDEMKLGCVLNEDKSDTIFKIMTDKDSEGWNTEITLKKNTAAWRGPQGITRIEDLSYKFFKGDNQILVSMNVITQYGPEADKKQPITMLIDSSLFS